MSVLSIQTMHLVTVAGFRLGYFRFRNFFISSLFNCIVLYVHSGNFDWYIVNQSQLENPSLRPALVNISTLSANKKKTNPWYELSKNGDMRSKNILRKRGEGRRKRSTAQ